MSRIYWLSDQVVFITLNTRTSRLCSYWFKGLRAVTLPALACFDVLLAHCAAICCFVGDVGEPFPEFV